MIRHNVQSLTPYVPGEQPVEPGVIKLNTNENPYGPAAAVGRTLTRLDPDILRRYPDPACREVTRRLAALHACAPDQILAANGSDEALALCTRAFVENDGAIGYFDPSYSLYPVLADIRGVRRIAVPLDDAFGWPLDAAVERLREVPACTLFFFTNPNAPTGLRCPIAAVRAFCERFNGVVVVDQAYVDFAAESCDALALSLPNVLVSRTFSKAWSMAGLRFGYVLGPAGLVAALHKIRDSYNVDALTQALVAAMLDAPAVMKENVRRVIASRERLTRELQALDWSVLPSETNFLWVKPRGIAAPDLVEALRERRILIRYFAGARTGHYVRISVGTDAEVDALVQACRDIMKETAP